MTVGSLAIWTIGHSTRTIEEFIDLLGQIDESAPAPVISAALYDRFSSRGEADFADKLLSAMRHAFGGHVEKASTAKEGAR